MNCCPTVCMSGMGSAGSSTLGLIRPKPHVGQPEHLLEASHRVSFQALCSCEPRSHFTCWLWSGRFWQLSGTWFLVMLSLLSSHQQWYVEFFILQTSLSSLLHLFWLSWRKLSFKFLQDWIGSIQIVTGKMVLKITSVLVSGRRIQARRKDSVKVMVKFIRKGIRFQQTDSRSSLEREWEWSA
jgi:hypothetical protein